MRRRDKDLERLFLLGLSLAAASCASATGDAGVLPPGSATLGAASATSPPIEKPPASARPVASSPPPDPSTPEGYALGYHSAGPFAAALSGLELQGFVDFDDDKLVCDGDKPCPAAWDSLGPQRS